MREWLCLCWIVLLLMATGVSAEIYKCVDNGVMTFSDRPCGDQATIVVPKTDFTVDEAIGNGSPYPMPVKYKKTIGQDLMMHAKRVGKSILPDDMLKTSDIMDKSKGSALLWTVVLYYVDREKEFKYSRIEFDYRGTLTDDLIDVKLTCLRVHRFDWATTPRTLLKAKKLKRDFHDGWRVNQRP